MKKKCALGCGGWVDVGDICPGCNMKIMRQKDKELMRRLQKDAGKEKVEGESTSAAQP